MPLFIQRGDKLNFLSRWEKNGNLCDNCNSIQGRGSRMFRKFQGGVPFLGFIAFLLTSFPKIVQGGPVSYPHLTPPPVCINEQLKYHSCKNRCCFNMCQNIFCEATKLRCIDRTSL